MDINRVRGSHAAAYQQGNPVQKSPAGKASFAESLKRAADAGTADVAAYQKYLSRKYGISVMVQSVGKDQAILDRAGGRMSGNDVVIAPNILEEMARDPEKAAYYEGKIEYYFTDIIPQGEAYMASQGLRHVPAGVVIHEDGTVTYIGGCEDSPERVAQVEAENKAKREQRAAMRNAALERSQNATGTQRRLIEIQDRKQALEEFLNHNAASIVSNGSLLPA